MKVCSRELGKINDVQSMVEILDENNNPVEWVVCSYYDAKQPFGSQWTWGHYFDSFVKACLYVSNLEAKELTSSPLDEDRCKRILQEFKEKEKLANGIMLWVPEREEIFQVMIGDGFNLLEEDRAQGLDGYLYIKTYAYDDPDFEELDGGQLDYRSDEQTYDEDITTAVYDALEFHYGEVPYFIPLQMFWH